LQIIFREFFKVYLRFLAIDLFVSLSKDGRNEKLILSFFHVFIIIVSKKFTKEDKLNALENLKVSLNEYQLKLQNNSNDYENIEFLFQELSKKYNLEDDFTLNDIVNLESILVEFLIAINELQNDSEKLKQPLIEFNNALSHIFAGYFGSNTKKNIERARTHLHRGTLDIYKYIIQIRKIRELKPKELVKFRQYEFQSIGIDVSNETKLQVLEKIKQLIKI
jgi:hypothetical protein